MAEADTNAADPLAGVASAIGGGDWSAAEAAALAAVAGDAPVAAIVEIATRFRRAGRATSARRIVDALVARAPQDPSALIARSQVAQAEGDLDGAIADTRGAMALAANPDDGRARLVDLLFEAGALDAAAAALAAALAIRRASGVGSSDLLMALLRLGRLADAIPDLPLRWRTAGAPPRPFPLPSWRGTAIADGALLVWGEQGLGEEIWASALLPDAARRAARLVVECAPRLRTLFARSFPAARVVARADPPASETRAGDVRAQCAAVDLLASLGAEVALARPHPPHLRADPAAVAALRARYRALGDGPLIGLSWRSANRRAPRAKTSDLADWRPILDRRAVLVDLQYGETEADRAAAAALGWTVHRDPAIDPLGDLDPAAAQVAAMDMVVTVSNTAAHLAGGLGAPSLVLLPRGRGQVWSWLDGAQPWYSRMRICRQPRPGDWTSAITEAARHLDERLK